MRSDIYLFCVSCFSTGTQRRNLLLPRPRFWKMINVSRKWGNKMYVNVMMFAANQGSGDVNQSPAPSRYLLLSTSPYLWPDLWPVNSYEYHLTSRLPVSEQDSYELCQWSTRVDPEWCVSSTNTLTSNLFWFLGVKSFQSLSSPQTEPQSFQMTESAEMSQSYRTALWCGGVHLLHCKQQRDGRHISTSWN